MGEPLYRCIGGFVHRERYIHRHALLMLSPRAKIWRRLMLASCVIPFGAGLNPSCHAQAQEPQQGMASSMGDSAADFSTGTMDPATGPGDYDNSLGMPLLKHIIKDQELIWTSPARVRLQDSIWLVPLGGLTAGLIATDRDISRHISNSTQTQNRYVNFSNYGIAALAGGTGALYLWGHFTHNDHAREAGLLAGEAAIDSVAVDTVIKYATGRNRPFQGNHDGDFWSGGDSFPSDHAAAAWSIAAVLSHEYPGPLPKLLAYGAAAAISAARVEGKQHFTSDVLVGSAIGWLTGELVYERHHDPTLGGGEWSTASEALLGDHPFHRKDMGSPYVPLDSWIYPALDRLEALGYVPEGFEGQRPWTRMECARLISDAGEKVTEDPASSPEASRILQDLNDEFANELDLLGGGTNRNARVESVYTRVTGISGKPLSDGAKYDYGQTIVNDYGRPYEEGTNVIAGGSGWATAGPLVGYVRAEYQYAPSAPGLPLSARQVIAQVQDVPAIPPGGPVPSISHADLLEGYVGMQFENWAITFGKQEQWWGPDQSGPMLFSDNAAPIEMLQINRVTPFTLPSILRYAGPVRVQFFLGRLSGQNWVFSSLTGFAGSWAQPLADQPFIDGGKISLKPTPNFEMGMGITTIFAGAGVPMTLHKFGQSILPVGSGLPGTPGDPGDRRGGFDFTYRFPKLRNWLTLYGDAFTDDEISPWRRWDKAAVTSGIYMPRIPKIPKLDFRAEGIYTDVPSGELLLQGGFFYFNARYRSGYTNAGNLIGSWIGRQGQGAEAWTTYWFTPKDNLQLTFRHEKVSRQLLPGGGTLTDVGARGAFWARSNLSVSGSVQYETWDFPVISPTNQSNVTVSVQLAFWPWARHATANLSADSDEASITK
jgi:membrane-associated phospholipid phosphatase